jgi:hypothetical protein
MAPRLFIGFEVGMSELIGTPVFVERINRLEVTDTDHADNFNEVHQDLINNDLWLLQLIEEQAFPSGTRMLFCQGAAPPGWVQVVDSGVDNRMLRLVIDGGGEVGGKHSPILMDVVPSHTHQYDGSSGQESHGHSHGFSVSAEGTGTATRSAWNYTTDPNPSLGSETRPLVDVSLGGGRFDTFDFGSVSIGLSVSGTTDGASGGHTHEVSGQTDDGSSQTNWEPMFVNVILCERRGSDAGRAVLPPGP